MLGLQGLRFVVLANTSKPTHGGKIGIPASVMQHAVLVQCESIIACSAAYNLKTTALDPKN